MYVIFKKLTLSCLLCTIAIGLSAQIGIPSKAKDVLKDKKPATEKPNEKPAKTEKAETAPSEAPAPPTQQTTPEKPKEQSRSGSMPQRAKPSGSDRLKPSTVELDFDAEPFAPAVAWESLLSEECWYFNCTNGEMKLNNISVSFLPKKTKDGAAVKYEGYANPTPLLRMEVVDTKTNTIKGTMRYGASVEVAPFYNMELLEGYDHTTHVNLTEGTYELRFWAGTRHFYTFPFEVEKKNNPDPYAPVHDFYFLKGPWQDWGRVEFGPDGHFMFNFYLSHQTTTVPNAARWDEKKEYKYLVKLYRDGKMVAVHSLQNSGGFSEGDLQTRNGVWKKFDGTLHQYPAKQGAFFMKSDMKDGNYTVEVWLKDKEGAETTHKYGFTVKNNTVVSNEKADRTQNKDPLQFLEQGPKLFYVKKL
jgi:hypothetical protein